MQTNSGVDDQVKRNVTDRKALLGRLTGARANLLMSHPFFGSLLLHVNFALAECETACTDMKRIIWDPRFLGRLSDEEVEFVLLHEVLHIVLNHCKRGEGLDHDILNVAEDIVVNSMILEMMQLDDFVVDHWKVIHNTPLGTEGRLYSAEQVYWMIVEQEKKIPRDTPKLVDSHKIWENIKEDPVFEAELSEHIKEAYASWSEDSCPQELRNILEEYDKPLQVNWKAELAEFIEQIIDEYDYTYNPPDKRFMESDFILHSFSPVYGEEVSNIWFLADTSGSIASEDLATIYYEILGVCDQFSNFEGKLSFFDTEVTEPVEFREAEDLLKISPEGGGGTLFRAIFEKLPEYFPEELPRGIVVLTDGYSSYPDEQAALDVPVLWIIGNNKNDAPWGRTTHISFMK